MLGIFHVIEAICQVRMKMKQNSKNYPIVKDVNVSKRSKEQTGPKHKLVTRW